MDDAEAERAHHQALTAFAEHRLDDCEAVCRTILNARPGDPLAWDRLAHVADRRGLLGEAVRCWEQALTHGATGGEVLANLAGVHQRLGQREQAAARYDQALGTGFRHPLLHSNRATLWRDAGRLTEAADEAGRALAMEPSNPHALTNLGLIRLTQGLVDEALVALEAAVRLAPGLTAAEDGLLFAAQHSDVVTPEQAAAWARELGERRGGGPGGVPRGTSLPVDARGRALRVGLISADFRQHSVRHFLEPLLRARDRRTLFVVGYSDVARPDAATAQLRAGCDQWRDVAGQPDAAVASAVTQDGIDVLVDLAGHTAGNRLTLFASRAAPVQVSYLGYPATTGLRTVDGRLTDALADPPDDSDRLHTERLIRMPRGFLCYAPSDHAPDVTPPPLIETGRVTFGCFGSLSKITPTTLGLWSRVLGAVPRSRLLVKALALADPGTRAGFLRRLDDAGVAPERVELVPPERDERAHLACYARCDLALDTFPYNGTTTTCEALWMGVPVVTLAGRTHAARVGVSLLGQVGLAGLVTSDADAFVALAAALAHDAGRLVRLRASLRRLMEHSSLMDAPGQAAAFEQALRTAVVGADGQA